MTSLTYLLYICDVIYCTDFCGCIISHRLLGAVSVYSDFRKSSIGFRCIVTTVCSEPIMKNPCPLLYFCGSSILAGAKFFWVTFASEKSFALRREMPRQLFHLFSSSFRIIAHRMNAAHVHTDADRESRFSKTRIVVLTSKNCAGLNSLNTNTLLKCLHRYIVPYLFCVGSCMRIRLIQTQFFMSRSTRRARTSCFRKLVDSPMQLQLYLPFHGDL